MANDPSTETASQPLQEGGQGEATRDAANNASSNMTGNAMDNVANDAGNIVTDNATDNVTDNATENAEPQQALPDNVIPLAMVRGAAFTELPQDLYIPPDALEVFLEAFEGPLDLLLYLIKRQNLDILDIPIAEITRQYMEYVDMMKDLRLELAADYLVMAAMLAEIKSRMLLPRPVEQEEEEDPRADLIRRLQEYERFKKAAEDLNAIPRLHRDVFQVAVDPPDYEVEKPQPQVEMRELLLAFRDVLKRAEMYSHHHIQLEPLSVRERMSNVLEYVKNNPGFIPFNQLFSCEEGRRGVVVTFLAILELLKELLVEIVQTEPYGPLHIKAAEKCQ
jgi:segregation and condensation protein A